MILYKKTFPLGKDVSFSRYIKTLNEKIFSPFTLLINEIPETKIYHMEIIITNPLYLWGWHSSFIGGVLLSECTILHSKGERYFTIQASPKVGNLFFALFQIISAIFFFILILSMMIIKDDMSLKNLFIVIIMTVVLSAPFTSTYLRDKKLLNKVGLLGNKLEKN